MATENNFHINTFSGGMNSDTSVLNVGNTQYLESRNVRLNSYSNIDGSNMNKQQEMVPIKGIMTALELDTIDNPEILATTNVRNYGVIIYRNDEYWGIIRFNNAISNNSNDVQSITSFHKYNTFSVKESNWQNVHKVSVTTRYEDENIIKLYIADGVNPILVFNIAPSNQDYIDKNNQIDKYKSYPKVLFNKPKFYGYIDGNLKASMVCYSYQIYNKNGISTDVSPACKLIPIGNNLTQSDISKIEGDYEGNFTNCGCQVFIQNDEYQEFLNRIIVYRIQYIQNGQSPTISIIYDGKFQSELTINDTGSESIRDISIEEYNSLSGIHIIPNVIENKDGYLFAANIKYIQSSTEEDQFKNWDSRAFCFTRGSKPTARIYDSNFSQYIDILPEDLNSLILPSDKNASQVIIDSCQNNYDVNKNYNNTYAFDKSGKYYGGSGPNIEWRFVISFKIGDYSQKTDQDLEVGTIWNILNKGNKNLNINNPGDTQNGTKLYCVINSVNSFGGYSNSYEELKNVYSSDEKGRWRNPQIIKSLRRDELYRYGIILYDNYGQPSPVKWIADIRTPNIKEQCFETFVQNGTIDRIKYECVLKNLGIVFKVNNLPDGCSGYEIVRCSRGFDDIATVSQGIVAKSVKSRYAGNTRQHYETYSSPLYFTIGNYIEGRDAIKPFTDNDNDNKDIAEADNFDNHSIIQFASPEICYQSENFKTLIDKYKYSLQPICYMYGRRGDKNFSPSIYNSYRYSLDQSTPVDLYIMPAVSNSGGNTCTSLPGDYAYLNNKNLYLDVPYQKDYFYRANLNYGAYATGFGEQTASFHDALYSGPKVNTSIYQWDKTYNKSGYQSYMNLYGSKEDLQVDGNSYVYIKPYTASFSANKITKDSIVDRYSFTENVTVNDIQIPTVLSWKDIQDQAYKNKTTVVGNQEYCNVVANAHFGFRPNKMDQSCSNAQDAKNAFGLLTSKVGSVNWELFTPQIAGPAGRCAILSIDSDNSLTNIYGVNNYLITNQDNSISVSQQLCQYPSKSEMYPIDSQSLAGTCLCNLRKQVTPYGGQGDNYRKVSTYYSDGDYFTQQDEWNSVFDGDVNLDMFEYVSKHKHHYSFSTSGLIRTDFSFEMIYCFPVEATINIPFNNGLEPYKNLTKNSSGQRTSYVQDQPADVGGYYIQSKPLYIYNTAYSTENKAKVNYQYSDQDPEDYNKTIDYRCLYSNKKENNESIDMWTKFQSSDFIDVNSNYGEITNLRTFSNQLMFWQQYATGILSVNERAITTDENSGTSIILGEGGVLSRYDYLDTTSGMHKNQFCDTQSNSTLYWYDCDNNEIKSYSQGLQQLSKSLFINGLLNKYYRQAQSPTLIYDIKNNEILFNILNVENNKSSITYNEQGRVFTSIYTLNNDDFVSFTNGLYAVKAKDSSINISQYDCSNNGTPYGYSGILKAYLKYAVNNNPMTTKVFDNQEIVTASHLSNRIDNQSYFSLNHRYSWNTDLISTNDTLEDQITLREGNYRYAIPRAKDQQQYGLRMRGKYMICDIENSNPNVNVGISYIITKFRQSWI